MNSAEGKVGAERKMQRGELQITDYRLQILRLRIVSNFCTCKSTISSRLPTMMNLL
jgi:hypothetical protein